MKKRLGPGLESGKINGLNIRPNLVNATSLKSTTHLEYGESQLAFRNPPTVRACEAVNLAVRDPFTRAKVRVVVIAVLEVLDHFCSTDVCLSELS